MKTAQLPSSVKPSDSFIQETAPEAAHKRGEEILGFPVIKGKTWTVGTIIAPVNAKQICWRCRNNDRSGQPTYSFLKL